MAIESQYIFFHFDLPVFKKMLHGNEIGLAGYLPTRHTH